MFNTTDTENKICNYRSVWIDLFEFTYRYEFC